MSGSERIMNRKIIESIYIMRRAFAWDCTNSYDQLKIINWLNCWARECLTENLRGDRVTFDIPVLV